MFIWFGLIGKSDWKNVWMWIDIYIYIIISYIYIYITILLFFPNNPTTGPQTTNLTLTDEGGWFPLGNQGNSFIFVRSVVLETFPNSSKWFATTKWFIVVFSHRFFFGFQMTNKACWGFGCQEHFLGSSSSNLFSARCLQLVTCLLREHVDVNIWESKGPTPHKTCRK